MIYHGKSEGSNIYKGQDIAIIGTQHLTPFIYKLIGAYLGYDTTGNMMARYVEHKEFRFKMMTFEDEQMRNLQFYFIESEMEQLVGRARLLRYDCTVYLFSNFPLRQAELIQDEYLAEE